MATRNNSKNSPFYFSLISGLVLLALVSAGLGFHFGSQRIWPYSEIQKVVRVVESLATHGEIVGEGRRNPAPAGAAREVVKLHAPDRAINSGYFALFGWDNARSAYSVFLYDAAGATQHVWPIDEMAISDKAKHRQNAPHAMEVLPDGSVLVSFDWLGLMARLDACGTPLWSREGFFHHSFSPAADGGIWTWYGEGTAYGQFPEIVKFDPHTGEDISRIDFTADVVMRTPKTALAFLLYEDFAFTPDNANPADIFHPNDVEELSAELAPAFPQFNAGDLMLSVRQLDMIAVISPAGKLKWYRQGPWQRQHDPDFELDGTIAVFSNNWSRPRSTIVSINPDTLEVTNPIAGFDGPFKTHFRGKHQRLPNGNRLITIPEQGQALEVAPGGTLVREFNNVVPGNPAFNDDLVNAKWYPSDFFETKPACSN